MPANNSGRSSRRSLAESVGKKRPNTMPLIFTQEFIASIVKEPAPFEGSLIKRLAVSDKPQLVARRQELEEQIGDYPAGKQVELIGRIRSFDDDESLAAMAELDVYFKLRGAFASVDVEPPLEVIGGKTPDFWVDNWAAFEVASTFAQPRPIETDLIRALNLTPSTVKIMGLSVRSIPEDKYPKLGEARDLILKEMEKYGGEPPLKHFVVRTRDGMVVTGYLYRGDAANPTVGGIIESYGFGPDDPDYRRSVRKAVIQKKYRKYRGLADKGCPLILVFHNHNGWLDPEDFEQVLFGEIEYRSGQHEGEFLLVRRDVVFGPSHYRGISAALLRDPSTHGRYFLAVNPHAIVRLGKLEEPICKTFNADPLPALAGWVLRPPEAMG